MLDDLQATGDVRVTLLETDQPIDSHRSGKAGLDPRSGFACQSAANARGVRIAD